MGAHVCAELALKNAEHAGVAEGVRLHPLEVEELRDTLVVGLEQLVVDARLDRGALDDLEAVAAEEVDLEGQAEQPGDAELARLLDQLVDDRVADAPPAQRR